MYWHRGEKPSAICCPSSRGAVASPMVLFYHINIFLSIISSDFTVCLFGCGDEVCFLRAAFCRPFETRAGDCVSIAMFCVRSRLSFFLCQEKRDGLRYVTFLFPRGSESPVVRSHVLAWLSEFVGSLWDCAFSCWRFRRSTKARGERENGVGGRAKCVFV